MLSRPVVSFHAVASDGVEHVVDVYAEDGLYTVTSDVFVTDAIGPDAYVLGDDDDDFKADFPAHPLPDEALRLIAGLRALQIHQAFTQGYGGMDFTGEGK